MTSAPSPAERYAAARRRRDRRGPRLAAFEALYDFDFDDFQLAACRELDEGHGILLAAPTGSGKTVVGEFAVHLALAEGRKCFYTTPIKALSNQKYSDLVRRYSAAKVGLLTGDNSINGEAPVVVMTTEVLRNMLYAGSPTLAGLGYVVLDEVHYLADRFRGAVWEEVIIHLPESVRLVALSATVSNAEEFGDWLSQVRGGTAVIVDETRPVPLWQHMMVGSRLYDLYGGSGGPGSDRKSGEPGRTAAGRTMVNPELLRAARRAEWPGGAPQRGPHDSRGRGRVPGRYRPPGRPAVIGALDRAGLLPAITFIFSRAGCDAAVRQCLAAGLRLTTVEEAQEITDIAAERAAGIPDADLSALGYGEWLAGLQHGIAAHHAGMLPTFKEVAEELFAGGLLRCVFATETLALGVNMPARTVVLERMDKWNGENHSDLTAGEYTQLTGRAGRRGIDVEGHAVVLWQPGMDPAAVAGLAGTRTYPLRSSFRPSYNMAVNLVGQVGRRRAETLLESSFAQFQADRAVVGIARQARRLREEMAELGDQCERGDFAEYARLRRELSEREGDQARLRSSARRAEALASVRQLRRGDIIRVPGGRRAGIAVVLEGAAEDGAAPLVLTSGRQVKRLSLADFTVPVTAIERVRIPSGFSARSASHRRDLSSTVRSKMAGRDDVRPQRRQEGTRSAGTGEDAEISQLRRQLRQHPCHGCPDRDAHAQAADRQLRLEREARELERRIAGRSHVIARTFDAVCAMLERLGYLDGESVTEDGAMLATLYTELDLLAAECLRRELWHGLAPAELAACVSALTFEARRPGEAGQPRLRSGRVREVAAAMAEVSQELDAAEKSHGLSFQRPPDPGSAETAYAWARGQRLEALLSPDLTPGDFVRSMKQLIDLLEQVAGAAGPARAGAQAGTATGAAGAGTAAGAARAGTAAGAAQVSITARAAVKALRRGVVSYSSVG